jgi:hypothetical protein
VEYSSKSGVCSHPHYFSPPPCLILMSCFRCVPESRLVCSLVTPAASLSSSEETEVKKERGCKRMQSALTRRAKHSELRTVKLLRLSESTVSITPYIRLSTLLFAGPQGPPVCTSCKNSVKMKPSIKHVVSLCLSAY